MNRRGRRDFLRLIGDFTAKAQRFFGDFTAEAQRAQRNFGVVAVISLLTIGKDMHENEISRIIIGASIEVHKELGPGLLESVYEHCLAFELRKRGIEHQRQVALSVSYKGEKMDIGYRLDLWVMEKVIVEIKTVETIADIHVAQLLTYLKMTNCKLGLLINFNAVQLTQGVRRVVNGLPILP